MNAVRKKVELTRGRINEMWGAAAALEKSQDPLNRRFSYAVAYNQDVIEREVKAFDKSAAKDVKFKAYNDERIELAEKHAHKDKDGNAIMRDNIYVFKSPAAFDKELEALRKKHPAYQDRLDYLEETETFEFHVVKFRFVPEYLSTAYMKLFRCFIEYEDDEYECPSCGAELCIEGNKLKEIYEEEEEKVEELPKKKAPKKPTKRRRKTG